MFPTNVCWPQTLHSSRKDAFVQSKCTAFFLIIHENRSYIYDTQCNCFNEAIPRIIITMCFCGKTKKKIKHYLDISYQFRVHTFRIDQNSMTFPWLFPDVNSNFHEWQYQSQKFYEFSRKNISGPDILASSGWNVKFPDISLTFLQNFIFPWHITEFPDNSLTLKKK